MKNRKFSLILALILVLAMLTGCGGDAPETQAPETEVPTTEAPVTEAPETEAPTTEDPETEPTATETPEENNLALGVVNGNSYTNTYVGIGCDLDSSWTIYPADELQEMPSVVEDMVEGTELEEALAGVTQFTDMYAENVELMANVNVLFQKLELNQRIAYAVMDEKTVLEATLSQKDVMIQAYAQGGIDVKSMEIVEVTFLGETHYALKTVGETQGVAYYCLQVFDFWLGEYSVTITFASFVEDSTETMLEMFYALD